MSIEIKRDFKQNEHIFSMKYYVVIPLLFFSRNYKSLQLLYVNNLRDGNSLSHHNH